MDNTKRYTKAIRDQLAGPLEDMGILVHRHIEKMHFNGRYQKMTIVLKSNVDVCACGKDKRVIFDVRSGELTRACGKYRCPIQIYTIDLSNPDKPVMTEIGTSQTAGIDAAVHLSARTTDAYRNPMVVAANEGGLKLAEVLKKLQANDAVYPTDVYDGKNWWFYEDHIWKMDKAAFHIHHTIVRTVRRDYAELIETTSDKNMVVPVLERLMGDINKRKFREVLVRDCAITFYDPIFLKSLNTKTHLVACKNGVYDLTAAEFRSGKPSDYLTFSTHRNFVAGMLSPHESISRPYLKILRECAAFIKDVLVEDAVIDMMLAALCMSMHGETMLHKFFLWVGCGSNGKSKLANLFRAALGDYSITIPVTVFTQKRIEYGRACPELQRTKGRRVVFISEPSHNETLNLGIVKEVTGGDAMYTRGLYEDGGEIQYVFLFKFRLIKTYVRTLLVSFASAILP